VGRNAVGDTFAVFSDPQHVVRAAANTSAVAALGGRGLVATVSPEPRAPSPEPCKPEPWTLHPQPYTLNPVNLNPGPYTLNHTP
jgi:hypothetical protein